MMKNVLFPRRLAWSWARAWLKIRATPRLFCAWLAVALAASAQTVVLKLSSQSERPSWGLCTAAACAVGPVVVAPYIVTSSAGRITKCWIAAGSAPTGADLIVDILRDGLSIFGGTKLVLPAGSNTASQPTITGGSITEGSLLTLSIVQVGSSSAGARVSVACRVE